MTDHASPPPPLRFAVGDRIIANTGDGWEPGIVKRVNHKTHPYKVKLDNGKSAYAPEDTDDYIRSEPTQNETPADAPVPAPPPPMDIADINPEEMDVEEMRAALLQFGLEVKGTKGKVKKRLVAYIAEQTGQVFPDHAPSPPQDTSPPPPPGDPEDAAPAPPPPADDDDAYDDVEEDLPLPPDDLPPPPGDDQPPPPMGGPPPPMGAPPAPAGAPPPPAGQPPPPPGGDDDDDYADVDEYDEVDESQPVPPAGAPPPPSGAPPPPDEEYGAPPPPDEEYGAPPPPDGAPPPPEEEYPDADEYADLDENDLPEDVPPPPLEEDVPPPPAEEPAEPEPNGTKYVVKDGARARNLRNNPNGRKLVGDNSEVTGGETVYADKEDELWIHLCGKYNGWIPRISLEKVAVKKPDPKPAAPAAPAEPEDHYVVTNAGWLAANGKYVKEGADPATGIPYYVMRKNNEPQFEMICMGGQSDSKFWLIKEVVREEALYYCEYKGSSKAPPTSGWQPDAGRTPCPTLQRPGGRGRGAGGGGAGSRESSPSNRRNGTDINKPRKRRKFHTDFLKLDDVEGDWVDQNDVTIKVYKTDGKGGSDSAPYEAELFYSRTGRTITKDIFVEDQFNDIMCGDTVLNRRGSNSMRLVWEMSKEARETLMAEFETQQAAGGGEFRRRPPIRRPDIWTASEMANRYRGDVFSKPRVVFNQNKTPARPRTTEKAAPPPPVAEDDLPPPPNSDDELDLPTQSKPPPPKKSQDWRSETRQRRKQQEEETQEQEPPRRRRPDGKRRNIRITDDDDNDVMDLTEKQSGQKNSDDPSDDDYPSTDEGDRRKSKSKRRVKIESPKQRQRKPPIRSGERDAFSPNADMPSKPQEESHVQSSIEKLERSLQRAEAREDYARCEKLRRQLRQARALIYPEEVSEPPPQAPAKPLSSKWWYAAGSTKMGPVPLQRLKTLYQLGQIKGETYVLDKKQVSQWTPIRYLPELLDYCKSGDAKQGTNRYAKPFVVPTTASPSRPGINVNASTFVPSNSYEQRLYASRSRQQAYSAGGSSFDLGPLTGGRGTAGQRQPVQAATRVYQPGPYKVVIPSGVTYRASPTLNDKVRSGQGIDYNQTVNVVKVTTDGWALLQNRMWLPISARGIKILDPVATYTQSLSGATIRF